ncbi:MAG TPA: hypothetical protein ENI64_08960 [Gammaproteobacteria bacterium]|nr:hypothetical protein [Gammaproteobacteria bacterium]
MSEIILCNKPFSANALDASCGLNTDDLTGFGDANPSTLRPYLPYLYGQNLTATDKSILCQMTPLPVSRELTNMSLSFGADNTLALAEISAKLQEYNIGMMGTSTAFYAGRIEGFGGAVKSYQSALLEYRDAVKNKPALKAAAKQKARAAFNRMQQGFRTEMSIVNARARALSRRGTPLTNPTRGLNIARSSRNIAKLNITSQVQASNLVKFGKQAKFFGNGLAVIDFGSRIGSIHNSYQSGGNWERDMFIESSSFAASAGAGILTINAGLALLLVATPAGWVGLVLGGIAIAGTAAVTSIGVNHYIKESFGEVYDDIMNWIRSW